MDCYREKSLIGLFFSEWLDENYLLVKGEVRTYGYNIIINNLSSPKKLT